MKRKLWLLLATIVGISFIVLASRSVYGQRNADHDQDSGGGWEYLIVQGGTVNLSGGDGGGSLRKSDGAFGRESYPVEKNMDKLGAKGWELVAVIGSQQDPVYYFKRRK